MGISLNPRKVGYRRFNLFWTFIFYFYKLNEILDFQLLAKVPVNDELHLIKLMLN